MSDMSTGARSATGAPLAATVAPSPRTYASAIDTVLASYRAIPPNATVRLAKRTSNLFRMRPPSSAPGLDVSGLQGVLNVDTDALTADVGGTCTYEALVAATLPLGLAPLVVPQLKTITVGGAATGGGIESSSFRSGLVYDGIVEMDVLTGAGEIRTASPDENADLFYGFPNSYGTLGYATRLRVRLERIMPFVALRHIRFTRIEDLQTSIESIASSRQHDDSTVDYLDGVVFGETESYLTLGTLTDQPGPTSDYTGQQIYYRSIQQRATDRLTIHDYLWRWDTDWFWCSRAFGAQQPLLRRLWPKSLRRSSFYSKLVALDRRFDIADRLEKLHHRIRELVPGHDSDRAGVAVPTSTAGEPAERGDAHLAALPDTARENLCQRRFLVGGPQASGRTRGRGQQAHRTTGQ